MLLGFHTQNKIQTNARKVDVKVDVKLNDTRKQEWQSHRIDGFLRYLLRRKTAMRFCDAMQSRITYTIFFAII